MGIAEWEAGIEEGWREWTKARVREAALAAGAQLSDALVLDADDNVTVTATGEGNVTITESWTPKHMAHTESKPKRLAFVVGPMSGYEFWNLPMFEKAKGFLQSQGWEVRTPFDLDREMGMLPGTDEEEWAISPEARAGYLARTITAIVESDLVCVLPSFPYSTGASVEVLVALSLHKEVVQFNPYLDDSGGIFWGVSAPEALGVLGGLCGHLCDLGHPFNFKLPYPFGTEAPPEPLGDERFHALLKQIGDLHDKKQSDYGRPTDPFANVRASDDFGVPGWVGALIRGNDKMRRLQKAAQGSTLSNEGVEDSLMDLAVYALIALVLYQEEVGE